MRGAAIVLFSGPYAGSTARSRRRRSRSRPRFDSGPDRNRTEAVGTTAPDQGPVGIVPSIDACNEHGIAMLYTGRRHFKH
jgi:hypothetical protein